MGLDRLYGGPGDDDLTLTLEGAYDVEEATARGVADGGDGNDKLTLYALWSRAWSSEVIDASGSDLIVNESGYYEYKMDLVGIEYLHLYGLGGDDSITGSDGRDLLHGGDHSDRLHGEAGDDSLYGGDGSDWLYGGAGDDSLYGTVPNADDILGSDRLYGGPGDDSLYGSSEVMDILDGGGGNDSMWGDHIANSFQWPDTFVFSPGSGQDTVRDFEDGASTSQDLIDVSAYGITRFEQLRIGGNTIDLGASAGGTAGVNTVAINFSSGGNMTGLTSEDFIFAA